MKSPDYLITSPQLLQDCLLSSKVIVLPTHLLGNNHPSLSVHPTALFITLHYSLFSLSPFISVMGTKVLCALWKVCGMMQEQGLALILSVPRLTLAFFKAELHLDCECWCTGVLHAGTQFCCPCLSHSALPFHPVYVCPSLKSTSSTMNGTGSHLHLKSWPWPASPHFQERFLYPRHFGFNRVCINCINYTGNTPLELLQSLSPSTVNST